MKTGGFKIGIISGSTVGSTGNKAITGVGFTPKLVRFTILANSTFNTTSTITGDGAMDGTTQFVTMNYNNGTTTTKQSSQSNAIGFITTSDALLLASYVSMDSDGFTINVGTANGTFDIAYECYG